MVLGSYLLLCFVVGWCFVPYVVCVGLLADLFGCFDMFSFVTFRLRFVWGGFADECYRWVEL